MIASRSCRLKASSTCFSRSSLRWSPSISNPPDVSGAEVGQTKVESCQWPEAPEASNRDTAGMNRDEMLRLFEAHREAEAARDVDAILATFVEDCFLETMALGLRA